MSIDSSCPVPLVFAEIEHARKRLHGHAVVTPLLESHDLNERVGGRVLLKAENLQRIGAFKFRGAYNRLSLISEPQRKHGVVACSSGNHAQGVAAAAALLGMKATIVMPEDAPKLKRERTQALGATVVLYDRETQDREAIAREICARDGAVFVHPYNDTGVIVGQGTVGLEIAEQCAELGLTPDLLIACAGGGGLASGIALALEEKLPDCKIYTAEPAGFDDYARSLAAGEITRNSVLGGSVCDAVLTEQPGEDGFEVLSRRNARGLVVTDEQALAAVAYAFYELKLVIEPGAAVAMASVLFKKADVKGRTAVVTLSGGNIDPDVLAMALKQFALLSEPCSA